MYVRVINSGKGFITHADWDKLSFSGQPNNIMIVTGEDSDINDWVERVGGTIVNDNKAKAEIRLAKIEGLRSSRTELLEEIQEINSSISELGGQL